MALNDPLLPYIVQRLAISIGTGTLFFGLIWLALFALRVKNPTLRYVFFAIPLVKSALVLTRQSPEVLAHEPIRFFVSAQLPSFRLVPKLPGDWQPFVVSPSLSWLKVPSLLLLILAMAFFLYRWYALWRFHKKIAGAQVLTRDSHPLVLEIANRLSRAASVHPPSIVMIATQAAPFTVGVRRPVIVLSPTLVEHLTEEELTAALAHEIAHIARRDYLYHWPIVILRDLLFFSPVTFLIYRLLGHEKERACDALGAQLIQQPLALANCLVHIAELRQAEPSLGLGQSFAPQRFLAPRQSFFSRRVEELIEPSNYGLMSTWRWAGLLPVIVVLLAVDVRIGISPFGFLFFIT